MINIGIIAFSALLMVGGKMPLLGGKIAKGKKVRLVGLIFFTVSLLSFSFSARINFLINCLILVAMANVYFFAQGEPPSKSEAESMLFISRREEINTYSTALIGLIICFIIIFCFIGVAFFLLEILKN